MFLFLSVGVAESLAVEQAIDGSIEHAGRAVETSGERLPGAGRHEVALDRVLDGIERGTSSALDVSGGASSGHDVAPIGSRRRVARRRSAARRLPALRSLGVDEVETSP